GNLVHRYLAFRGHPRVGPRVISGSPAGLRGSFPRLEAWLRVGGADAHMGVIEGVIEVGEVTALMRAAALGAGERARGDQAHQGMRIVGEPAQPVGVALEARMSP